MNASDTDSALAAFIAKNGVTKCPPADGDATPLRVLRKQAEAAADAGLPVNVLARDRTGRIDPSAEAMRFQQAESFAELGAEMCARLRAIGNSAVGFDADGNAVGRDDD